MADIFDRDGDGYIDYYEFVAALHPNKDAYRPTTDADKIEDEVGAQTRTLEIQKCRGVGRERQGLNQKTAGSGEVFDAGCQLGVTSSACLPFKTQLPHEAFGATSWSPPPLAPKIHPTFPCFLPLSQVTRQVAQCKCAKRFQVEQIGENKYRVRRNTFLASAYSVGVLDTHGRCLKVLGKADFLIKRDQVGL